LSALSFFKKRQSNTECPPMGVPESFSFSADRMEQPADAHRRRVGGDDVSAESRPDVRKHYIEKYIGGELVSRKI
jgi:hypothetical protein